MKALYPIAVFFALSLPAVAVELNSARIEYSLYHEETHRDPLLERAGTRAHEGVNLGLDVDLLKGVHWDNLILAKTDRAGYRSIAWDFRVYVSPIKNLDIGYHHVSRHLLDRDVGAAFPVEDSLSIIWRIYARPGARSSWF